MDRGAWKVTVHGVTKKLDMTERLKNIILIRTECEQLTD